MKRLLLWLALLLILLLTAFSIYGAFLGADNAKVFFNSLPMSIYWLTLGLVFIAGIVFFSRLHSPVGSFATHFGCLLVLAGGFWGSQAGIKIHNYFSGTNGIIHSGQMYINKGQSQRLVMTESEGEQELPFAIRLVNFVIEYYEPGELIIKTLDGTGFKVPAESGQKFNPGPNLGTVTIVRQFEKFRILLEDGKKTAIDDPNGGPNPALELLLKNPDGTETTKYVFERFAGHTNPNDKLRFIYVRTIRDYISDVEVVINNVVLDRKRIEVNKPLHFGGYLFYQQGYDSEAGQYTILGVVSDTGLTAVHIGFFLLCAGLFWNFWLSSGRRRAGDG
ncbi:MAG: cytochrome c biogenesis protein ResB [Sedimentisphaerales bacterium]